MTKIPTTRGQIQTGDVIDGEKVTDVQHKDGMTRLHFKKAGGWAPWCPSDWWISVWR